MFGSGGIVLEDSTISFQDAVKNFGLQSCIFGFPVGVDTEKRAKKTEREEKRMSTNIIEDLNTSIST
tara:strand:+ start:979 stop:1179 length:201 start_codon:yes stop_codon:yes gene_type:complete